jgi:hypothetical protein
MDGSSNCAMGGNFRLRLRCRLRCPRPLPQHFRRYASFAGVRARALLAVIAHAPETVFAALSQA